MIDNIYNNIRLFKSFYSLADCSYLWMIYRHNIIQEGKMSLIKNGIIHEHHSSEGVNKLTCIPLIQSLLIVHLGGLSGGIDISGDPCTLCLRSGVLRLCFASEAVFNSFTLSSSSCKKFVRTKKNNVHNR